MNQIKQEYYTFIMSPTVTEYSKIYQLLIDSPQNGIVLNFLNSFTRHQDIQKILHLMIMLASIENKHPEYREDRLKLMMSMLGTCSFERSEYSFLLWYLAGKIFSYAPDATPLPIVGNLLPMMLDFSVQEDRKMKACAGFCFCQSLVENSTNSEAWHELAILFYQDSHLTGLPGVFARFNLDNEQPIPQYEKIVACFTEALRHIQFFPIERYKTIICSYQKINAIFTNPQRYCTDATVLHGISVNDVNLTEGKNFSERDRNNPAVNDMGDLGQQASFESIKDLEECLPGNPLANKIILPKPVAAFLKYADATLTSTPKIYRALEKSGYTMDDLRESISDLRILGELLRPLPLSGKYYLISQFLLTSSKRRIQMPFYSSCNQAFLRRIIKCRKDIITLWEFVEDRGINMEFRTKLCARLHRDSYICAIWKGTSIDSENSFIDQPDLPQNLLTLGQGLFFTKAPQQAISLKRNREGREELPPFKIPKHAFSRTRNEEIISLPTISIVPPWQRK